MNENVLYSNEFLSAKRMEGDTYADSFIEKIFSEQDLKTEFYNWFKVLDRNSSLDNIPAAFKQEEWILNSRKLPYWADPAILESGAQFFNRYSKLIMQLLGLLSLPYCYAAADGAMVLYLSGQLRNNTAKRLTDTAQFVSDVQSYNAFSDRGKAFASILKTRITHAIARYYIQTSGKWNSAWGYPINQEDMAGTNLAFSLLIVRGLRKAGIHISYPEQQSFLHIWNVTAYLLGINESLIPKNGKEANLLEKSIRQRQFKPSDQGRELTRLLIHSFTNESNQSVSIKAIKQTMNFLLGKEISGLLDIQVTSIPVYIPHLLKLSGMNIGT